MVIKEYDANMNFTSSFRQQIFSDAVTALEFLYKRQLRDMIWLEVGRKGGNLSRGCIRVASTLFFAQFVFCKSSPKVFYLVFTKYWQKFNYSYQRYFSSSSLLLLEVVVVENLFKMALEECTCGFC